jgi:tetratricopeptide (TPR) repeat protein
LVGKEYLYDICHWYRDRYILVSEEIVKSALEYFKTHLNSSLIGSSQIENNHFLRIHDVAVSCPINLTARERAIEMLSHTMLHLHRNYDIVLEEESLSSIKIAYQLAPEVFESRDFLKEQLSRVFYSQGYTPGNCLNTEEFWDTFLMYFAETLRRLGEYAKAIDYFDEVNNREQNFCFLYLGRSMAYCKIGQTERAKADFEELSKRNCNNKALELYRELLRF